MDAERVNFADHTAVRPLRRGAPGHFAEFFRNDDKRRCFRLGK